MSYHSETIAKAAGALGLGGGGAVAVDAAEGNGMDKSRSFLEGIFGGLPSGLSPGEIVARVTPDFIADFVSGIVEAARGGGDVAGQAADGAAMLVPYLADVVEVVA